MSKEIDNLVLSLMSAMLAGGPGDAKIVQRLWKDRGVAVAALESIASMDYRGNPSPEQDIARAALRDVGESDD